MIHRFLYGFVCFLSSFLLFQLELMAARMILPEFGAAFMVWIVCSMFFQLALLLGYLYAQLVPERYGVLRYGYWHPAVLVAAALLQAGAHYFFSAAAAPQELPWLSIFLRLSVLCLPTFFALATMTTVVQRWFSLGKTRSGDSPYVLFAASNLGSLLGLLSYPLALEPVLTLPQQQTFWWSGYALLTALTLLLRPRGFPPAAAPAAASLIIQWPRFFPCVQWFLLACAGVFSLLAVTNVLTFDIAPVPFLWALPLGIYLLSFVLTFKRRIWFPGWLDRSFGWAAGFGAAYFCLGLFLLVLRAPMLLALQLGILFILTMNCQGRLSRMKPDDHALLPAFYTIIAGGGFFAAAVAGCMPLVSRSLLEYPLSFALCALAFAIGRHEAVAGLRLKPAFLKRLAALIVFSAAVFIAIPLVLVRIGTSNTVITAVLATAVLGAARLFYKQYGLLAALMLTMSFFSGHTEKIVQHMQNAVKSRSFYGIYSVYESGSRRVLRQGGTIHGMQYVRGEKTAVPLLYFHPTTPAGDFFRAAGDGIRNAAMIGLGAGAMSVYFSKGCVLTVYELDPEAVVIADTYFSYLRLAAQRGVSLRFITGDGRISLRGAPGAAYDALIIDAFNNDAIPTHLLTQEAFREYLRVLGGEGAMLMHISNRVFNLSGIIAAAGRELGLAVCEKFQKKAASPDAYPSQWIVLSRNPALIDRLVAGYGWTIPAEHKRVRPWTDHYTNLLEALRR